MFVTGAALAWTKIHESCHQVGFGLGPLCIILKFVFPTVLSLGISAYHGVWSLCDFLLFIFASPYPVAHLVGLPRQIGPREKCCSFP